MQKRGALGRLTVTLRHDPKMLEDSPNQQAVASPRIENHYMRIKGWLEEGALLTVSINRAPGVIVQGLHDAALRERGRGAEEGGPKSICNRSDGASSTTRILDGLIPPRPL